LLLLLLLQWRQLLLLLLLLLLLCWLPSKRPPRHKLRQWPRLLSRQLALHVVLPGCNSVSQQLIVLPSTEQRPRFLR
jgi:hypothetical protein